MEAMCTLFYTPIGWLGLQASENSLTEINFLNEAPPESGLPEPTSSLLEQTKQELTAYFDGKRPTFSIPLCPKGTPFQLKVWQLLTSIPYGKTCSYLQLAQRLGDEKAVRAVGLANGKNPLPIIIPCHRVIGANGSLTGYAGGLARKRQLLELEGAIAQLQLF